MLFALAFLWSLRTWAGELPSVDEPLQTGERAPADAGVVIGIEHYLRPGVPPVPFAKRDAEAFSDFLISTRGVPTDRVRLVDRDASAAKIRLAVEALGREVHEGGLAWVYFAGHGAASLHGGERMLLGDEVSQDPETFDTGGVSLTELADLARAGGGKVVIIVDACYTGVGRDGTALLVGQRTLVPAAAVGGGSASMAIWTAAGGGETAGPLDAASHGAFTYLVLGALRGWADGAIDGARDGSVSLDEGQVYVSRALRQLRITSQTPEVTGARDLLLSNEVREAPPALAGVPARGDGVPAAPVSPSATAAPVVPSATTEPGLAARLEAARKEASAQAEQEFIAAEAERTRQATLATLADRQRGFSSPSLGNMKWIPPGSFLMGSPQSEDGRRKDETQHKVTLSAGYWIMEHEVTQEEWVALMGPKTASFDRCGETCPVESVSLSDAEAFARAASARDGLEYRLPTEAEWEYAARGGQTLPFAGGRSADAVGWIKKNSDRSPHPVCTLPRNGFGLCDMTGNVWEWVSDRYGPYEDDAVDPTGPEAGHGIVIRGGSWNGTEAQGRVTNRAVKTRSDAEDVLGFRLVRVAPPVR